LTKQTILIWPLVLEVDAASSTYDYLYKLLQRSKFSGVIKRQVQNLMTAALE
jgi:hypothetical protein